jgi:type VI protein secretion system component Hcp
MVNSGEDESDNSVEQVDLAWDKIDWDAHIETPPKPKKVGKIKAIFKYIGKSKPIPRK